MFKFILRMVGAFLLVMVLAVLNPHRLILLPVRLIAAGLSWVAWRLEDFAEWVDDGVEWLLKKLPVFFDKSLGKKCTEEIEYLKSQGCELDKKYGKGEDDV